MKWREREERSQTREKIGVDAGWSDVIGPPMNDAMSDDVDAMFTISHSRERRRERLRMVARSAFETDALDRLLRKRHLPPLPHLEHRKLERRRPRIQAENDRGLVRRHSVHFQFAACL
jgi:hypothetical protein